MASTTDAPFSQVATLYGHYSFRWSEFKHFQDEADQLEERMARMAIVHRLSGDGGYWYVCPMFVLSVIRICRIVASPLVFPSRRGLTQEISPVKHSQSCGRIKLFTRKEPPYVSY